MQGIINGQSGSSAKINGIIEEYKVAAGENVNAGDFVTFINKNIEKGTHTQIKDSSITYSMYAILLEKNKVLIVYSLGHLYGTIVTINGETITAGTETKLSTNDTIQHISLILLERNKVFINYYSSDYLYGTIVTINGETISKRKEIKIVYIDGAYSSILLEKNKILIAYNAINTQYLCGTIVTINGETISKGAESQFKSDSYSDEGIPIRVGINSMVLLEKNKIFISCVFTRYLYGMIVTINGTTITSKIDITRLETTNYSGRNNSVILLSENKVLIIYSMDVSSPYFNGLILTINGETITTGTKTKLTTNFSQDYLTSIIQLDIHRVLIVNRLNIITATINGTTITKGTETQLVDKAKIEYSLAVLNGNEIFIADAYMSKSYTTNTELYGILIKDPSGVSQIKNISDKILGLSKTKGTEGQLVKVVVPEIK